jgi:hypothetical protein
MIGEGAVRGEKVGEVKGAVGKEAVGGETDGAVKGVVEKDAIGGETVWGEIVGGETLVVGRNVVKTDDSSTGEVGTVGAEMETVGGQ